MIYQQENEELKERIYDTHRSRLQQISDPLARILDNLYRLRRGFHL